MRELEQAVAAGAARLAVLRWRGGVASRADDWVSQEVAVALEYNGVSHAVMLATPLDLDDFALGFSLSEGILQRPDQLYGIEQVASAQGITLQLEVATRCFEGLKDKRRNLTGRTGCGLCGTENLQQALRPLPQLPQSAPVTASAVAAALRQLPQLQRLGQATGSVHAAAFSNPAGAVQLLREDVGRHNALDKLVGALARSGTDPAGGFMLVSSRASVEMVQKAALAGCPLLVAVSAPTALAVASAAAAGMTLAGLARGDDLVIYAGAERLTLE